MPRLGFPIGIAVLVGGLAGCNETFQRLDGLTPGAGNALAANTAIQMVDPWQYGVQNTNLVVPADRGERPGRAAPGPSAGGYSAASADSGSSGN
ncbi:hypothetical protein SAZ10_13305 [Mesorhizobium sp. BAC0120]|uniref:hypothetical protein n=1 Tax=Mesorhizobium sp. BAC0120 TaxID=3090670 RepID=UPI00298C2B8A|nr:hypothetical protein [Mesorhizobium sp. BAC0120]MDW6022734.1 hypothetical protein [Mesorhizobium sp. BAC0120]